MRIIFCFFIILNFAFSIPRPKFEDFEACYQRNKASIMIYEGMNAFALSENLLAVIKKPDARLNRYVKYDPFLNLYLVRTDFSLIPPVMGDEQNLTRADWIGIVDPYKPYIGHLKYLGQNLEERDKLDFISITGQLSSPCCKMLGIALPDSSFIGNRYLKHFMKYNDVYWGDIGVDFISRNNRIYVNNVRKNGQFLVNDEVLSVDGEVVRDLRKLNEKILFADRGSTLYFNVLRDNQDINISTIVFPIDISKFDLPSNRPKKAPNGFRSNLGISVNSSLIITKIDKNSKAYKAGFMVGDKILRVNNVIMKDFKTLQNILTIENSFNVLIQRQEDKLPLYKEDVLYDLGTKNDGEFQFFIRLNK